MVPKRLGMKKAESISFFVVTPLRALSTITSPFVKLLTVSTNFIVRLFGIDPAAEEEMVTEEEIRMLVEVGEEKRAMDDSKNEMINTIFEFDNKVVSDIMTHRTEIVGIPTSASIKDIIEIVKSAKFTRYPVYEDNIDDIIGILNIKDLIQLTEDRNQFDLKQIIRQPYYVPASKKADELFRELQSTKTHMAVAIDEYGGTAGIVTIEDLLEEIVGNIFDEYDVEEKEFEKIDDNTFIINGVASLDRVTEFLKVDLPIDDYDTLSGFLIGQLGRIPEAGETPVVEYDEIIFKVEEIEEKRIAKVKACRT